MKTSIYWLSSRLHNYKKLISHFFLKSDSHNDQVPYRRSAILFFRKMKRKRKKEWNRKKKGKQNRKRNSKARSNE
jgi:hypothetical protein